MGKYLFIFLLLSVWGIEGVAESGGRKPAGKPASTPQATRFYVGFLGGMNFGYGKAEPQKEGSTRNALSISAVAEFPIENGFSFAPEISLVQRGVQTTLFQLDSMAISGNLQLDYLELPLLFRYRFRIANRLLGFGTAGPSLGLLLGRNIEVAGILNVDLSSRFSQIDYGIMGGFGLGYMAAPKTLMIAKVRYTMGLKDIDSTENNFYTRGIQLLIGFEFGF